MRSVDEPAAADGTDRRRRPGLREVVARVAEEPFDRLAALARDLLHVDWAVVTVHDEDLSRWVGYAGEPRGVDPPRGLPLEQSFCRFVVQDQRPLILDDVRLEPRTARSPLIDELGLLAWAGWPVLGPDGEVLGSFCLACSEPREWTIHDVRVLRTLALAATTELGLRLRVAESERDLAGACEDRDTARQFASHALEQAQTARVSVDGLEHELLRPLPRVNGLDLGAEYRPAGGRPLGGDWYDAIRHPDGATTLVVGKVSDVGSATLASMAQVRDMTRTLSYDRQGSPADVLQRVERAMTGLGVPGSVCCVVAYLGVADPVTGRRCLRWSVAGGPTPLLHREATGAETLSRPPDLALGVSGAVRRTEHELELDLGSTLVLLSDGILDGAADPRSRALARLLVLLGRLRTRTAHDTAGMLVEQSGAQWTDDVTVLVARTTAPQQAQPYGERR